MLEVPVARAAKIPLKVNATLIFSIFTMHPPAAVLLLIPLEDKDSEIPAFQQVLNTFTLNGAMITADALHCQRKTFEIITAKKGEYTVKVKDNQPSLKQHIIDVLERKKDKCVKESFNNCDYEIFFD